MSNTKLNDLAIGIKTRNNKHAPYMHLICTLINYVILRYMLKALKYMVLTTGL